MQFDQMKRREFITLLGGAAVVWPLAARAQQGERMRSLGALTGITDEPVARARAAMFTKELEQLGWSDGRNIRIDYRWGGGDPEIIRRQAAELVALAPDVILATGGPALERMLQVTRFPMPPTLPSSTGAPPAMSIAFSRVRSPPTCRCRRRPSTN